MLSKRETILEDKDCANMLGLQVNVYRESLKSIKAPAKENIDEKNIQYDNNLLKFLGIKQSDLKKRNFIGGN